MKRIALALALMILTVTIAYCKTTYTYKVLHETKLENGNSRLLVEYSDSTSAKKLVAVVMKSSDVANDDAVISAVDAKLDKQDAIKPAPAARIITASDN